MEKYTRHVKYLGLACALTFAALTAFCLWNVQHSKSQLTKLLTASGGEIYFEDSFVTEHLPEGVLEWLPAFLLESSSTVRTLKVWDGSPPPDLLRLAIKYRVKHLDLCGSNISNNDVRYIMEMRQLKSLDLRNTPINNSGFSGLASLALLEELFLDGTLVTDDLMESIVQISSLKVLALPSQVSDGGVKKIAGKLPNLEQLFVDRSNVTESTYLMLAERPRLQILSAIGCPNISNAARLAVHEKFIERLKDE